MSDLRQRRLERALAPGDIDAEGRLLRERLRRGDLDETCLAAAADLGFEPARIALGRPAPEGPFSAGLATRVDFRVPGVAVRVAIAAVRVLVPFWEASTDHDGLPRAISAASACRLSPSDRDLRAAARQHANDLWNGRHELPNQSHMFASRVAAENLCRAAGARETPGNTRKVEIRQWSKRAIDSALLALLSVDPPLSDEEVCAQVGLSVVREVVPWLLGSGDPLLQL